MLARISRAENGSSRRAPHLTRDRRAAAVDAGDRRLWPTARPSSDWQRDRGTRPAVAPRRCLRPNAAIIGAAGGARRCRRSPRRHSGDEEALASALARGLQCDLVIFSGGTSKGEGDLSYRVVGRLSDPGVVVHGVALKPGKPICLAVTAGKPVVILPGFPTSAIFTFHEFVAPVIRALPACRSSVRKRWPPRFRCA